MQVLSLQVHQRIFSMEEKFLTSKQNPFEATPTGNLAGDFDQDLRQFSGNPQLEQLLRNFQEVFGPLPPQGKGIKLVTMDIKLLDEWKNVPLRGKCWAMPEKDVQEIDQQVDELLKANLVEMYPPGEYPKFCSRLS